MQGNGHQLFHMITLHRESEPREIPYKDVQRCRNSVHEMPSTAILQELIKPLEERMRERGFLSSFSETLFYPMWFLAETEMNVFLWQNGLSLADRDYFEFWIDLEQLTEKRLAQLDAYDKENPFLSPLLGAAHATPRDIGQEEEYIASFKNSFAQLAAPSPALSCVGSALRAETPGTASQSPVLLPG